MSFVRITCSRPGFRRAGVAHGAVKTWPADTFSTEQLAQLRADPAFTVEFVATEEPSAVAVVAGRDPATIAAVVRLLTRGHQVEGFIADMTDAVASAIERGESVDAFWPTAVALAEKHGIAGGQSAGSTNSEGAPAPVLSTGDAPDEAAASDTAEVGSDGVSSADDGAAEGSGEASEAATAAASEPTESEAAQPKAKARRAKASD